MTTQTEPREFTQSDWYGWCGAEAWDDSQPLIYEHSELNAHYTIIADKNGFEVCVTFESHVDETTNVYHKDIAVSPALAKAWLPALAQVSEKELVRSGFYQICGEVE